MNPPFTALQLADWLQSGAEDPMWANHTEMPKFIAACAATELRRLYHNNQVLENALWKACGDDKETVNATIESQGELK
jgi:hypothetical protein